MIIRNVGLLVVFVETAKALKFLHTFSSGVSGFFQAVLTFIVIG